MVYKILYLVYYVNIKLDFIGGYVIVNHKK
jgi:hypothetical protein